MRAAWLLLFATGLAASCGPSQTALKDPAEPTRMKAPTAYRTVEKLRYEYRLGRGCGSGPFELTFDVPALPGVTRLRILSVGAHELPLRYDLHLLGGGTSYRTFIHNVPPDARCAAREGEVATLPLGTAPVGAPAPAPIGRVRGRPVAPAAPVLKQEAAILLTATPAALPALEHTYRQGEMFFTDGVPRDIPDLDGQSCWSLQRLPTTSIKLKLWLTTVQHLDDLALHLVLDAIEPLESAAIFEQRIAARLQADAALAASRADVCGANPHDAQCFVGCARGNKKSGIGISVSPGPLPPPPVELKPPRPQPGAEWIAGAWRWSGVKYEWDAGFWRLPSAPTVTAVAAAPPPPPMPRVVIAPPPPPRIEQAPPPPAAAMLWVPGYWAWNGTAWMWILGAWQAPPAPAARFVPPRIVVVPGGVTFDPGRWILRLP